MEVRAGDEGRAPGGGADQRRSKLQALLEEFAAANTKKKRKVAWLFPIIFLRLPRDSAAEKMADWPFST
jgi:hypothetical protein